MKVTGKFRDFWNSIFSSSRNEEFNIENVDTDELVQDDNIEEIEEEIEQEKIDASNRTIKAKLYLLEQEIAILENSYQNEHKMFMKKIEQIRERCKLNEIESNKVLTFTITPENDLFIKRDISMLRDEIKYFIETQVKFDIFSKQLERLILKLNLLYNVSIFHSNEEEKQKAMSQVIHAIEVEKKLINKLKENKFVLLDKQLKDRIVSLISYLDYEIFKLSIRNSGQFPNELAVVSEFYGFDYVSDFTAFIKDEITDLVELVPLIKDSRYNELFKQKVLKLLEEFVNPDNDKNQIMNITFWNNFLSLETNLLKLLKTNGVDSPKIKLIARMDINTDESEVLKAPKICTYLSMISLFSETHDKKFLIVLKLIENLSDEITYREIYFLLLLFETIENIKSMSNELFKDIKKYVEKYPYDNESIRKKKKYVMDLLNKNYVIAFYLDEYKTDIITTLKSLNIDFKVVNDYVFLNSFYFKDLKNVFSSMQLNTQNTTI
ncbi:MAG: hypothetical protein HFJ60_04535 [Clostridia bacterium]|jgi:hypothetical protein|nr:hypothetical protein [Clostridia bacterium]